MRWFLTISALMAPLLGAAALPFTGMLRLEIGPELATASPAVTRLDWILSKLELVQADDSWMPSAEWIAFFNQSADTLDPNLAQHPTQGLGLNAQEKSDLVAFLGTLTDESLITPSKTLTRSPSLTPLN